MTAAAERGTQSPGQYRVVGTRAVRHDGFDKVTGAARFGADINLPGMLHGKILRSPTPTPESAPSTPARPRHCRV
jgi:xanthine dehydrogenase molybdenum-binding subunit